MIVKRICELKVGDIVILFGSERTVVDIIDGVVKFIYKNDNHRHRQTLNAKSMQRVEVIFEAKSPVATEG